MRSSSSARSLVCRSSFLPCARAVSTKWSPTLRTGLSEFSAAWKTMRAFLPAVAPQVAAAEGKEVERAAVAGAEPGASPRRPARSGPAGGAGPAPASSCRTRSRRSGQSASPAADLERRPADRLHLTGRRLVLDPEVLDREHDVVRQHGHSRSRTSDVGRRTCALLIDPIDSCTRHPITHIIPLAIVD